MEAYQHSFDDHGFLINFRPLAETKQCGDEFSREASKEKQRQVEVIAVVMFVNAKLLLPMGIIFTMVHIQNIHFGNYVITVDELIQKTCARQKRSFDVAAFIRQEKFRH